MSDSLRVAMVIQRFRPMFSGQGIQVEALASTLAGRGVDVTILTATTGCGVSVEQCDRYRVVRLGNQPPRLVPRTFRNRAVGPTFAARVFAYLQDKGAFDLIHVHAMTDALYASYAWCRLHDRPLIFELTLLGADDPLTVSRSTDVFAGLRYAVYRRCDGFVAISPALETTCGRAMMKAETVRLIPQGVDVRLFSPADDRKRLRDQLGLPSEGQLVVFVGSLIRRKGIDVLLEAWSRVCRTGLGAQLLLVGRDEFGGDTLSTEFLSAQLARVTPAAAGRIHRLGVRADVHRLLQASDLFVFPSRREGFGTVMAEAMACGLPSVVTELPGITDFIFGVGDRTGVVVPQEDPDMLASAVAALLGDRVRAERVGRAARKDAVERFDMERIAEDYLQFYSELLTRDPDVMEC